MTESETKRLIINEETKINKEIKNETHINNEKPIGEIKIKEEENDLLNSKIMNICAFIIAFIIIIIKSGLIRHEREIIYTLFGKEYLIPVLDPPSVGNNPEINNEYNESKKCKDIEPFKSFKKRFEEKPVEVCRSLRANHICYKNNINNYVVRNGVICKMENFVIDPTKWKDDGYTFQGPVNNITRGCPILSYGFFNIKCSYQNNVTVYDKIYKNYFDSWNYNYNNKKEVELAPGKIVFFISRNQDSPNLYFGGAGIMNALAMMYFFQLKPEDIQVVFLESMTINNDPYYDFYKLMISRGGEPIHIRDLHKKYHISKAIHVPINWDTPLFIRFKNPPKCKYQSKAFYYLNKYIDEYMNIPKFIEPVNYDNETFYYSKSVVDPNSSTYTKFLTFQWRKAWPRGRKGQERLIGNGPEIIEILTSVLPKNILVRLVDTASLTMIEQISLMRKTDYFLGVHGAGLFLSVFLPPTSILHEISLPKKTNNLLLMSSLSGHRFFTDIFKNVTVKEIDGSGYVFFNASLVANKVLMYMNETNFF